MATDWIHDPAPKGSILSGGEFTVSGGLCKGTYSQQTFLDKFREEMDEASYEQLILMVSGYGEILGLIKDRGKDQGVRSNARELVNDLSKRMEKVLYNGSRMDKFKSKYHQFFDIMDPRTKSRLKKGLALLGIAAAGALGAYGGMLYGVNQGITQSLSTFDQGYTNAMVAAGYSPQSIMANSTIGEQAFGMSGLRAGLGGGGRKRRSKRRSRRTTKRRSRRTYVKRRSRRTRKRRSRR